MIVPAEKAKKGIDLVEQAILEFIASHPSGVSNAEIAKALGLESDKHPHLMIPQ